MAASLQLQTYRSNRIKN